MERKVSVKDYEKEQHYLLCALNLVGVQTDYLTTDLIHRTLEKLKEKGAEFDIKDSVSIKLEHEKKWEAYFKNKELSESKNQD